MKIEFVNAFQFSSLFLFLENGKINLKNPIFNLLENCILSGS